MSQPTFQVQYQFAPGFVRVILESFAVMEVGFSAENYSKALFERLKLSEPFIPTSQERRNKARKKVGEKGKSLTDEEIEAIEKKVLRKKELEFIEKSIEPGVKYADEHLVNIVKLIFERVINATAYVGANQMRDTFDLQDQKYKAKDIKKGLFDPEWELIKPLAGITHGGARKPRKSTFTWDDDKAQLFYETVESLPKISKKSLWEYAQEQLRDNDYDSTTVTWLESHPALADIPENSLREAATKWRHYEDEGQNIPPDFKPLAFAFRHACHKLNFPAKSFNTLKTQYYKGKKSLRAAS